jgi:hypothetical protein
MFDFLLDSPNAFFYGFVLGTTPFFTLGARILLGSELRNRRSDGPNHSSNQHPDKESDYSDHDRLLEAQPTPAPEC